MMSTNKSIDGLRTKSQKKRSLHVPTVKTRGFAQPTSKNNPEELVEVQTNLALPADDTSQNSHAQPTEPISTQDETTDFLAPVQAFDFDSETGELTSVKPKTMKKKNPSLQSTAAKKKAKKKTKIRRVIAIICLMLVLFVASVVIWIIFWGNDIIAKITGGQGNVFDLLSFVDETYEPLKTDTNGRTNILAFGTSGYNMEGDEGKGTHDGAQLTDSIMLISLNQETGDIAMLSFPRDLKVSRVCTATGKVNEIYWCNNMYGEDEEAGAAALMAEMSEILGVDIQYYAHINWGSLVQIVDLLGGINVTLDEGIYDYYYTKAVFDAGVTYTINGEQALGLSRARHGTSGGDFSRGASQQKILIGIKEKIFEKNLSLSDLLGLASTLGDNLRTNFSVSDLKTLAHLALTFDFDNMRQLSLLDPENGVYLVTTGTINEISYVLPAAGMNNYRAIRSYVAKMLSNDPRSYEEPSILILNGTDIGGLASSERAKLLELGYSTIAVNDAVENFDEVVTIYSNHEKPGTEELLEDYYDIDSLSFDELPDWAARDYDFVIILGGEENTSE